MKTKTHRLRRVLKWVAMTCLLSVLAGEFIARYWIGLGSPPLSAEHPTIEYMFLPGQDVYRFHNHHLYNRYGMRSEEFEVERSEANELRILVLGDSVINGGNQTDQSRLATSILDTELEEESGFDRVIVGNVSAGSWGPQNQLAYVREYGFFSADLLLLVISSHDAADVPTFAALNPNTHPTSRPYSALLEGIRRYFPLYLSKHLSKKRSSSAKPDKDEDDFEKKLKTATKSLRELLTESKASVGKLAVVQYLSASEIATGVPEQGFHEIQSILDELDIPTFSTKERFTKSVNRGQEPFRDSIHPNDLGQQLLAECLLQAVNETLNPAAKNNGEPSDAPEAPSRPL